MFRKTMMKNNKSKGSVSSEHKEIVRDDILQYELLEGNGPKGAPKGDPIMQVRDLHVSFATEAGVCRAVRGVNFDLWRGRTLGIVGESGSGKSVTALSLIGLLDDNAKVTGSIIMNGEELIGKTDEEMSEIRGERIAMVFQDPLSALTPMFTIGDQIAEGLITHHPDMSKQQIHDRCVELLDLVGIPQPEERLSSFPHQFSGGMRQRVMIAIAIANNPDVIIADEPTTALDVTIQAQILDVLAKAQKETGAAVVLITHDLGVVAGARRHPRHVCRSSRRARQHRRRLPAPLHAVHDGSARRRAEAAHRRLPASRADSGQPAVTGRHPEGMPVLATMPARHPGVLAV